jgi:hypothetical protein
MMNEMSKGYDISFSLFECVVDHKVTCDKIRRNYTVKTIKDFELK